MGVVLILRPCQSCEKRPAAGWVDFPPDPENEADSYMVCQPCAHGLDTIWRPMCQSPLK